MEFDASPECCGQCPLLDGSCDCLFKEGICCLTERERQALVMASRGMFSGGIGEWPILKSALKKVVKHFGLKEME